MPHLSPRADTRVVLIVWLLFLPLPLYAGVLGSTSPINSDASGLALRGYDPVAYFETGKPTQSYRFNYQPRQAAPISQPSTVRQPVSGGS